MYVRQLRRLCRDRGIVPLDARCCTQFVLRCLLSVQRPSRRSGGGYFRVQTTPASALQLASQNESLRMRYEARTFSRTLTIAEPNAALEQNRRAWPRVPTSRSQHERLLQDYAPPSVVHCHGFATHESGSPVALPGNALALLTLADE